MAMTVLLGLLAVAGVCQALLEGRQDASSTSSVFTVPTASPAPNINSSVYDLSQHFCRLFRHASVYAEGKIYIDGGNTYVPNDNKTFNNTLSGDFVNGMMFIEANIPLPPDNQLLVLDLSKNFSNQDSFPYTTLHKGPDVPNSLIEHALWYSRATRKVYQLGGWFSSNNVNDPGYKNLSDIPEAAIWEFDIDSQTWAIADGFTKVNTGTKVERQGAAGYCDAPSLNMSFIFEGYVQQRSDQDYIGYSANSEFKFLEGMLALDTAASRPTLTNISVPLQMGSKSFGPRMNGATVHVPVGELGVVVQIGGQITSNPTAYGRGIPNASGGNTNIDMSFVDIYDIKSQIWFRQQTFGLADGIPDGRSDICCVVVTAKDNSSYNIYVVAGVKNYNSYITTEEIWVLTLPTFQWLRLFARNDGLYGHTCHAVGENLLIIGGMQTMQGSGGNVKTCANHMPAEIFSLKIQNYTGQFDADGAKRTAPVPDKVVAAIGGTGDGGAYVRTPKVWSDLYLQYVFDPSLTRPANPTPAYVLANGTAANHTTNDTSAAASDSGPSKNVIIGASVGGVVGALVLGAAVVALCIMIRRKRRMSEAAAAHEGNTQSVMSRHSELPAYSPEALYVKYDTGFYHGMQAVSVPQTEGPAELGPDAVNAFPRSHYDLGADVPISMGSEAGEHAQGHPYSVSNSVTPPGPEVRHLHTPPVDHMGGSYAPGGTAYSHEWTQQQDAQAGQGRHWQQP